MQQPSQPAYHGAPPQHMQQKMYHGAPTQYLNTSMQRMQPHRYKHSYVVASLLATQAQSPKQQASSIDLFNTLMTRVLDRSEGRNYKAVGPDMPEHLHALEIDREQFVKWIEDYQLLFGMKLPTASLHTTAREIQISIYGSLNVQRRPNILMARHMFQYTLEKRAFMWFKCLDKHNIIGWIDLRDKFIKKIKPMREYARDYVNLHFINQIQDEHLIDFTKRSNGEARKIPGFRTTRRSRHSLET